MYKYWNLNDDIVRRIFTAYMQKAVRHDMQRLDKKAKQLRDFEVLTGDFSSIADKNSSAFADFSLPDGSINYDDCIHELIEDAALLKIIEALSKAQKIALIKKIINQQDTSEIAAELGVSMRAVNKNAAKAIANIRKKLN